MATLGVRYQTIEFGTTDIHIRSLRDNQEFSDDKGEAEALGISSASWPLFGIVWPSGEVLAQLMVDYAIGEKRIVDLLSEFINQHAAPQCDIILVDPGRGHRAKFSKKMVSLGYSHSQRKPEIAINTSQIFSGQILSYSR